ANFANRMANTGPLKGTPLLLPPLPIFRDTAKGADILTNVIFGVFVNGTFLAAPAERSALPHDRPFDLKKKLYYKARPLNGVWATAPYLHNGSVPNLWELLSASRNPSFQVGSRIFDPVKVGFDPSGSFTFDTTVPGNYNTGHPFGTSLTDPEKW